MTTTCGDQIDYDHNMMASSTFAIPLLHLLPKPRTMSLMFVLALPCLAMVIGNKYLDFCCVCVRGNEREREVGKLIVLKIDWISVCVCERVNEIER